MLTGSELTTAITAVLIGAVVAGFLLHWLWSYLSRAGTSQRDRLNQISVQLHDAEMARDAAEVARQQAEKLVARREAEAAEHLAWMQARLDGTDSGRETELTGELAAARQELETMGDELSNARQRITELESALAAPRKKPE